MVERPLLTAICRASHVSQSCQLSHVSEIFPLQTYGHQILPTPTVSVVCQSPPAAHSWTLHLPPPHHVLSASPHHNVSAPTNRPGCSETLASQLLPPVLPGPGPAAGGVWECSCQCRLWGCRKCIPPAGEGKIAAIGRGRKTDISEPAEVKRIQTPRAL